MTSNKFVPTRDDIIAVVGGLVDETRLTLGMRGADLDPSEISEQLGCPPTLAYRRGDARPRGAPPWPVGAWLLTVEGKAPTGPDELFAELFRRLTVAPQVWEELRGRYEVRVSLGLFLGAWNRGFSLSQEWISRLARMGVGLGFDIYADDGEEADVG
jgi:hypothetical protein